MYPKYNKESEMKGTLAPQGDAQILVTDHKLVPL